MEAQAEKLAADAARTLHNAERAKEHGLVEKTAGESGAAGFLRNKWVAFLESLNGKDIAARLAVGGGADGGRGQGVWTRCVCTACPVFYDSVGQGRAETLSWSLSCGVRPGPTAHDYGRGLNFLDQREERGESAGQLVKNRGDTTRRGQR